MQNFCTKIMSPNNYNLYCEYLWLSQMINFLKLRNNLLKKKFIQCPHIGSCDQYRGYEKKKKMQ